MAVIVPLTALAPTVYATRSPLLKLGIVSVFCEGAGWG